MFLNGLDSGVTLSHLMYFICSYYLSTGCGGGKENGISYGLFEGKRPVTMACYGLLTDCNCSLA